MVENNAMGYAMPSIALQQQERQYKGGKMKNWIIQQVNSEKFQGLEWVNGEKTKFKVPWRHAKKKGYNRERDAALFKEWAIFTGKSAKHSDPTVWKINFRCALNSLKDIRECKEDHTDSYKVYEILPYPSKKKSPSSQKNEVLSHSMIKRESVPVFNLNKASGGEGMMNRYQDTNIDYYSKFRNMRKLEKRFEEIGLRNGQIGSNISDGSNLFSDYGSPYNSPLMSQHGQDLYDYTLGDLHPPDIYITEPEDSEISHPASNISDSSVNSYHTGPPILDQRGMREGYPIYLPTMPHILIDSIEDPTNQLYPPFNHLPVNRSRSMDELSSQQNVLGPFTPSEPSNIYKWHSTGNLENQGNWYYPMSAGSSMSSLGQDDFMKIFKSEILSDSGDESNQSEYLPADNMYGIPNMIHPPPDFPVMEMIHLQQSHSIESEPELYIDVNHDPKF